MPWTNVVLWAASLAIAISLIVSAMTIRERSLIETLKSLILKSNPPNEPNLGDDDAPAADSPADTET